MLTSRDLSTDERHVHEYWMDQAIELAKKAADIGEVPIGAIVVKDDQIIGQAYNLRETDCRATAHAELLAIESANQYLGAWRLEGASLYVTLEPCPMCAGAIINARIHQVIYGASDTKAGCGGSLCNLIEDERFNHQAQIIAGIRSQETGQLLSQFFKNLRQSKKSYKQAVDN